MWEQEQDFQRKQVYGILKSRGQARFPQILNHDSGANTEEILRFTSNCFYALLPIVTTVRTQQGEWNIQFL